MADSVRVQFSASIGALIQGVEDAKRSIQSMHTSFDTVTESAKGLLEVFGVAFSAGMLADAVKEMAEYGEQVERTAAQLGVSSTQAQQLGLLSKLAGGDAQELTTAMERLEVNLQHAKDGTSQQAQALRALGLSAREMLSVPVTEQVGLMAGAYQRLAEQGINPTAAGLELMGRGAAGLTPLLERGRQGIADMLDTLQEAQAVLSQQTVEALSAVNQRITLLGQSARGLGGTIVGEMAPAIEGALKVLTDFIASITESIKEGGAFKAVIDVVTVAFQAFDIALATAIGAVEVLWENAKTAAKEVGQVWMATGRIIKDALTLNFSDISVAGKDLLSNFSKDGTELGANMAAIFKRVADEIKTSLSGAGSIGGDLPQGPQRTLNFGTNKDAFSGQIKSIAELIQIQNQAYQSQVEQINSAAKAFEISEEEKTRQLIAAVQARVSAVYSEIDQEIAIYRAAGKDYSALELAKVKAVMKGNEDIKKDNDQAMEQYVKDWQGALQPLTSAFDSQLKKILSGTETFGQAMKNVFADLVMDAIKELEKLAITKAATGLASSVGSPQGLIGSLFGGAQAGGGAANTTALTTALTALTTALGLHTTVTTAQTTATAAQTVETGANTVATSALVPPLLSQAVATAGNTIATIANTVGEYASKLLPSFDVGTWSVPHDMVAQVHQNEMIVPNNGMADAMRGMLSGGGAASSNSVTINGAVGTQQWLNQMVQQFNRVQQQYNARTPSNSWS